MARASGPAGTLHACRGRPPTSLCHCPRLSSGAAAALGRGSPRASPYPHSGTAAMGAIVGLAVRHRARRRRAAVDPLRPRPARVPRVDGGPPGAPAAGAARQPADARRPTSRARSRSSASPGWWPCCARRGCPRAIVWSAVVATHVTLLLGPPLSLTDVFNYLHYGRMPATYGVNPYAALPLTVRQDPAYHFSNWHHLPSPYGPLFTLRHRGPRSALAAHRVLGVEGRAAGRRAGHPRAGRVHRAPARPLAAGRGRARRAQPARPRLRHRRRAQRAAGAAVQRGRGRRWRSSAGRTGRAPWWDVGAGACAVLAAGFKPSAALLAPVVILACRRRLPALGGAGSAGVLVLARRRAASTAATCPRRASRTGSSDR